MSLDPSLVNTKDSTKDTSTDKNTDKSESNVYPEIDLVFCMDCTASMSSYINSAKNCIMQIVEKIKASEKADVRFAYIAYRDHKDQFVTKVHEFTTSLPKMRDYVSKYGADGGGDGPEAVTAALNEALKLQYRKTAVKITVIIADAPPHGVTKGGDDDYPKGDPNGLDPIKIAKKMAEDGIVLYVVACEPELSNYKFAHDFMAGLAKITEGKYLPLTSAHLLPDVIIGGAKEEISLQKLEEQIVKDVEKLKKENPDTNEDDLTEKVAKEWAAKGAKVASGELDDIYGKYNNDNIDEMANNWSSIDDFQNNVKELKQPQINLNFNNNNNDIFNSDVMNVEETNNLNENEMQMPIQNFSNFDSSNVQSYNVSVKEVDKSHVKKLMKRADHKSKK